MGLMALHGAAVAHADLQSMLGCRSLDLSYRLSNLIASRHTQEECVLGYVSRSWLGCSHLMASHEDMTCYSSVSAVTCRDCRCISVFDRTHTE